MKKLLLLLFLPACTFQPPVKQAHAPKQEPELYIPAKVYASEISCELTATDKFGVACTAVPRLPKWADCLPNYHKEKQLVCTDKQSEPAESHVVCHLNFARTYTNLCGLECTMHNTDQQIIIPPDLDRNEASTVK